jgi:diguanylate cyclase (GGDEF)-like protein
VTTLEAATDREPLFVQASREVLSYLRTHAPMAFWAVTRVENGRQTYLVVDDEHYGLAAGGFHAWSASFCISMSAGAAPRIAPDAQAVPAYAAAGVNDAVPIGAYAGAVIDDVDGGLFGAICGLDPDVKGSDLAAVEPLLLLLSRLLSLALVADREREAVDQALLRERVAADVDPLTGVYSRRAWDRLVAEEAVRYDVMADPTAVVIVDLDELKSTNDQQGHAAGDALITRAAEAIRAGVRSDDPVARLGGDEFGILLRHCSEPAALARAEQVRASLAASAVRASVGVAAAVPGKGLAAAIDRADAAMYAEKQRGRA